MQEAETVVPRVIGIEADSLFPCVVLYGSIEFLGLLMQQFRQEFLSKSNILLIEERPTFLAVGVVETLYKLAVCYQDWWTGCTCSDHSTLKYLPAW